MFLPIMYFVHISYTSFQIQLSLGKMLHLKGILCTHRLLKKLRDHVVGILSNVCSSGKHMPNQVDFNLRMSATKRGI